MATVVSALSLLGETVVERDSCGLRPVTEIQALSEGASNAEMAAWFQAAALALAAGSDLVEVGKCGVGTPAPMPAATCAWTEAAVQVQRDGADDVCTLVSDAGSTHGGDDTGGVSPEPLTEPGLGHCYLLFSRPAEWETLRGALEESPLLRRVLAPVRRAGLLSSGRLAELQVQRVAGGLHVSRCAGVLDEGAQRADEFVADYYRAVDEGEVHPAADMPVGKTGLAVEVVPAPAASDRPGGGVSLGTGVSRSSATVEVVTAASTLTPERAVSVLGADPAMARRVSWLGDALHSFDVRAALQLVAVRKKVAVSADAADRFSGANALHRWLRDHVPAVMDGSVGGARQASVLFKSWYVYGGRTVYLRWLADELGLGEDAVDALQSGVVLGTYAEILELPPSVAQDGGRVWMWDGRLRQFYLTCDRPGCFGKRWVTENRFVEHHLEFHDGPVNVVGVGPGWDGEYTPPGTTVRVVSRPDSSVVREFVCSCAACGTDGRVFDDGTALRRHARGK